MESTPFQTSEEDQNNQTELYYDETIVKSKRLEWIICDSLAIPFALIALYSTFSQIAYLVLKKRSKNLKKYAKLMAIICIFSSGTGFLRVGIDLRLVYGREDDFGCNLAVRFDVITFQLSILASYFVFWLKQRMFYQNSRLKHLSSGLTRALSWLMLVFMMLCFIVSISCFLFGITYEGTPLGCKVVVVNIMGERRWILLIVSTVIYQTSCLILFIYPLARHHRNFNNKKASRSSMSGKNNSNPGYGRNSVIKLVKRAAITTIICIGTDLLCAVITPFLGKVGSADVLLYDVDIVTNSLCLIFSFPDWKMKLMPWRIKRRKGTECDIPLSKSIHSSGVETTASRSVNRRQGSIDSARYNGIRT